jgi:hypothetical protein
MNIENKYRLEIWIGLATVKPIGKHGAESLQFADVAFTNVLSLAANKPDFRKRVKAYAMNQEWYLERLEEAEPLFNRLQKYKIDKNLIEVAKNIIHGNYTLFGIFHTYKKN